MTAISLNHVFSSALSAIDAEDVDIDYLIIDWLRHHGHDASELINVDPSGQAAMLPVESDADLGRVERMDWRKDFRDSLMRATVRLPPHLFSFHPFEKAQKHGK